MVRNKKIIFTSLGILLLVIIVSSVVAGYFFTEIFTSASDSSGSVLFTVEPGQGVNQISKNLMDKGLIRSRLFFELYVWLKGAENKIIAAEYKIPKNINIVNLVYLLRSGPPEPREREIRIIEGWSTKDIGNYLETEGIISSEEFLEAVKDYTQQAKEKYDFLASLPEGVDIEGYLFPDTYRIFINASAKDIIDKMLKNFDNKLTADLREAINDQAKTIHEIVTMASIIEKEVPRPEDRAMVADIFYKRLEIGMPLQSDATVNYVTGKNTTRPTQEDVEVDSPYNTYKYPGLPPAPISNPSLDAIKAAIYPKSNIYLYFLTTKDKKVIYSVTGEEHNWNKAKFLN